MAKYDERGREIPDPRPVAVPLGVKRTLTMQEELMRFIRTPAFHQAMEEQQGVPVETFEEADDFDVEDPEDFSDFPSQFEMHVEAPDFGSAGYQQLDPPKVSPPPAREGGGVSDPPPPVSGKPDTPPPT